MKILVFSDIHGDVRALGRLLEIEADYYFAAGDMVNWMRGLDEVGEVLARRAGRTYVIPGNHETADAIAGLCERHGLHAFHGQTFEANGVHVAGLGYSTHTPFHTPGEYTERQMAERLDPFANLAPLVMVCHAPPMGTELDRMGAQHAGSQAVRDFIDRAQPAAFFCGHIHEAQGRQERIGRTMAYNVGKQGVLFDFATIET